MGTCGRYNRLRDVDKPGGTKNEKQWIETSRLRQLEDRHRDDGQGADVGQPDKIDERRADDQPTLEDEGDGGVVTNHNTLPHAVVENPYAEPTRPDRQRKQPDWYQPGRYAMLGMPGMPWTPVGTATTLNRLGWS